MRQARQTDVEYVAEKRKDKGQSRTGSELDRKYWAAMAMFAVLAALVWLTMGEGYVLVLGRPVELRLVPLVIIGGLALRTMIARHEEKIRRKDSL
ncbi:MAG: hypothetical protein WB341_12665 [Terracidiphilus sp.]